MILWTLISAGLFAGMTFAPRHTTRRSCQTVLIGWLVFSVALLMLGGPAID